MGLGAGLLRAVTPPLADRAGTSPQRLDVVLSPRQLEVLQLVARGLTSPEIGQVLGISSETVRTHVAAVLARLEVSNRTEAATVYLEWSATTLARGATAGGSPRCVTYLKGQIRLTARARR